MVLSPNSMNFSQPSADMAAVFADMSLSMVPTPQNVQFQHPYTFFANTSMGTFPPQNPYNANQDVIQDPYLPLQHAPHSSYVLPRTTIASFDNSIRAMVEWSENDGTGLSGINLTPSPTVVHVAPQSFLSLPPSPTLTPRWFEVPQRLYEHRQRQLDFRRSVSIAFSVDGFPGISMEDAFHKHFAGLDGRDDLMLQSSAGAISCRFLFPGYPDGSGQISTLDWRKNRARITRSKLAYEVAKKLDRYLKRMAGHNMDESFDQHWKIGEGFMRLENMYLVRLVPVSLGSFQPEIWIQTP